MKVFILLLTILLVGGAPISQIAQEQKPITLHVIIPPERKVTDSLYNDFINAADESDRKTLLLIAEKKRVDRDNVFLRKENARLRQELKRIDTVYIKKPNLFKRLFNKKKARNNRS